VIALAVQAGAELRRWRSWQAESAYRAVMAARRHLRLWLVWADAYDRQAAERFTATSERDWAEGSAFNYAAVSGGAIVGAGLALPGVDHLLIVHDAANWRSAGVARRLGFTEVGRRAVGADARILGDVEVVWRLPGP
jgi:ribosomal-protein-serine acetyltransferase